MSANNLKLQLGPLPSKATVKMTIVCTAALKEELDRYAALHAEAYGQPVDACVLIPLMLEAFVRRDRVYRRKRPMTSAPKGVLGRHTTSTPVAGHLADEK